MKQRMLGDRKPKITFAQITRAHEVFQAKEPRDLSYRVATELVASQHLSRSKQSLVFSTPLVAIIVGHETLLNVQAVLCPHHVRSR